MHLTKILVNITQKFPVLAGAYLNYYDVFRPITCKQEFDGLHLSVKIRKVYRYFSALLSIEISNNFVLHLLDTCKLPVHN